jgi:hypothetical protein
MSRSQYGQVLIIYLTTLFIGGSSLVLGMVATGKSTKELEKGVKATITDPGRQKHVLDLLEQWEDQGESVHKEYVIKRKALANLITHYGSKKQQFNSIRDELLVMDDQTSKQLLDIQYSLRKAMTRKEWDAVFAKN